MKKIVAILALTSALVLSSCANEKVYKDIKDNVNKTGQEIKNISEDTKNEAGKGLEDVKDGLDDAGRKIEGTTENMKNDVVKGMKDVKNKV